MDNISDDNLKRLAKFIAEELINLIYHKIKNAKYSSLVEDNIIYTGYGSKSSSLNTATQYLSSSSIYRSKGAAGDKALESRISG